MDREPRQPVYEAPPPTPTRPAASDPRAARSYSQHGTQADEAISQRDLDLAAFSQGVDWPKHRVLGWLTPKRAPVPDLPLCLRPMQGSLNHVWVELEEQYVLKNRYTLVVWSLTVATGVVGALTTALAQFSFGRNTASAFGVITAVCALLSGFLREHGQPELAKSRYLRLRKIYFDIETAFYSSNPEAMRAALERVDDQVGDQLEAEGGERRRHDSEEYGLKGVEKRVATAKEEARGVLHAAKNTWNSAKADVGGSSAWAHGRAG